MARGARAVALWCAVAVISSACARAYTVDCNHEYTDCDTELSKIASDDEEIPSSKAPSAIKTTTPSPPDKKTTLSPIPTPKVTLETNRTEVEISTEAREPTEPKPKPRLLNLSVDELQNFANALHNQTNEKNGKKGLTDLSDVTMDDDDDETPRIVGDHKHKDIPDKFYANLQAPFHPLLGADRGSEEIETCKENEITYKVGDHIDRGCEESCECSPSGIFECSPRCKHPYIRRGRRVTDPLCFESPVDECCSIMACATGNGDMKTSKLEVCRYGNDTFPVGAKWNVGCEQSCSCESNSVVTCKPRCKPLPPSDKCINVQDPNDACCEVQVCDVSQDVHEESTDNMTTSTTTSSSETARSIEEFNESRPTMRPLVLAEPIGSVKVLHNNTVRVNLMHMNNSVDPIHLLLSSDGGKSYENVELKYSNLILNLDAGKDYILKTRETGTKFNFTITASNAGANEVPTEETETTTKVGCYHDGHFYAVGEEFHIGCSELCECTGPGARECAALLCPAHVGLELVSKGCVRWAPSPPPQPPNCCPRSARCLSDGTCHYNDVAVPNWSEVPISLTGCEKRCFCENGELDCQDNVCSPVPPVPPQSLRCPPMHRPAHVNISDEDCCKQWGCVPNAAYNGSITPTYSMPTLGEPPMNYVTPVAILPTIASSVLPSQPLTTDSIDFYKHLSPVKSLPKYIKTVNTVSKNIPKFYKISQNYSQGDNITVFTLDDLDSPFKTIHAEPPLVSNDEHWKMQAQDSNRPKLQDSFKQSHISINQASHSHPEKQTNFIISDRKMHDIIQSSSNPINKLQVPSYSRRPHKGPMKQSSDPVRRVPISQIDNLDLFLPTHDHKKTINVPFSIFKPESNPTYMTDYRKQTQPLFEPLQSNKSSNFLASRLTPNFISNPNPRDYSSQDIRGKHVTVLRTKDLKMAKPTIDLNRDVSWHQDNKAHLLTKAPSPYETVLLRAVPNARTDVSTTIKHNVKVPQLASKTYSTLDLEHLLSQMEVESAANRNLGRSADKNQDTAAGQTTPPAFPAQPSPQHPSFLPTIPPEIHFPQDDIPDYDENNIHRPLNFLEPNLPGIPPGLPASPNNGDDNKKLTVISLQADSPTSVKMLFGLPPVLVGLRGSVDLRYTDKANEDISHWYSQVFAPADEVLTTPRLEFRLTGLKPSTTYKIRGKLYLHNLPVEPESEIYSVRTPDIPTAGPTLEEKRKEIDSRLRVVDVNDTSAHISWRHFNEDELQFIDGIQVRYRPVGTPIYSMTELLHHSRSAADLHDLRPGSRYEASLVLVPPPRATTELHDPGRVEFTTAPFIDPYNWTISVEARAVGSEAVELTWRGVPAPAERWVRVYRAVHACGTPAGTVPAAAPATAPAAAAAATRHEHDAFRLAARDLPPTVTLTGLEPNTKCRVWLELFLTNGKVKTSNVLEITTKSVDSHEPIDNEIELSSVAGSRGSPRGDYYGALVVVGVVAALGALTSLLLLLVVVRRHRPRSVPITPVPTAPRESSLPPYDNPAYKLELQQETMDL